MGTRLLFLGMRPASLLLLCPHLTTRAGRLPNPPRSMDPWVLLGAPLRARPPNLPPSPHPALPARHDPPNSASARAASTAAACLRTPTFNCAAADTPLLTRAPQNNRDMMRHSGNRRPLPVAPTSH
jgi:hypothetical protein